MSHTVYRFLDKNLKIIYVGRTHNLLARMNTHFGGAGHLPEACYEQVHRVDYVEFKTSSDMKIKELYYISKYKPIYNTADMVDVSYPFNELDDVWVTFDRRKERVHLDNYRNVNNLLVTYLEKNEKLLNENEELKERVEKLEEQVMALGNQTHHKHHFEMNDYIAQDVSFKKALAILQANPEKAFVNLVDGEIRMEMFVHNEEVICRLYLQFGEKRMPPGQEYFTIILESPFEERKRTVLEEKRQLPAIELVYTVTLCNNWLESTYSEMEVNDLNLTSTS